MQKKPIIIARLVQVALLLLAASALALVGCQPQPAVEATASVLSPTLTPVPEANVAFAANAFPPPMPDKPQHHEAWLITDCMGCHDGEVTGEAPEVVHEGLPEVLLEVNCRTCHVVEAPALSIVETAQ